MTITYASQRAERKSVSSDRHPAVSNLINAVGPDSLAEPETGNKKQDNATDGHHHGKDDKQTSQEEDPDAKRPTTLTQYLTGNVDDDLMAEIELLLLTLSVGIQDATTFPDYHVFASNQTGNTVLLAVAIAGLPGRTGGNNALFIPANIAVSLCSFIGAGLLVGQLGNAIGSKYRPFLIISNLIQTLVVFAAAALQYTNGVQITSSSDLGVISCLAMASGAQVALSRALKVNEIPTAMATAAWIDTMVDPYLLSLHNRKRNRRVLFISTLFIGGLIGVYCLKLVNSALALVVSGVLKSFVTVLLFFNKAEKRSGEPQGTPGQARQLKEAVQDTVSKKTG